MSELKGNISHIVAEPGEFFNAQVLQLHQDVIIHKKKGRIYEYYGIYHGISNVELYVHGFCRAWITAGSIIGIIEISRRGKKLKVQLREESE